MAVDKPNVRLKSFRLPDAPPVDAGIRDTFENLHTFLLNGFARLIGEYKHIPVPGRRKGVSAIRRQIHFGYLPALQQFTVHAFVGGKTYTRAIFAQVQILVVVDKVNGFFFLFHQQPPFSNSRLNLLRPSGSVPSRTVAL